MKKWLWFVVCLSVSAASSAIVIRHDQGDKSYLHQQAPMPALVTFTSMHQGKPYVVGSGTYIGDGWVLTAAHVAHFLETTDVARVNGEQPKVLGKVLHSKWRDRQVGYDIALVML